jgi:electron transfer flavoprotein alpha subunit
MPAILVIAEQRGGKVKKAALSAVTFARAAQARQGGDLHVLVLGEGAAQAAGSLRAHGAAAVHVASGGALDAPLAAPWAWAVQQVADAVGADLVVGAATSLGKDVLPRVAVRLGAGMASDVSALVEGAQGFVVRRPMFAGNVVQTVRIHAARKVVSVRPTEFAAAAATGGESPLREHALSVPEGLAKGARYVGFEEAKSDRPELTDARVVVSGGRGVKSPEGYKQLVEPLADVLGAATGASRAICDAGWVPNDWQVGQTGKVVAPDLYIAVGISGAIQHVAGMRGSKVIVAINKDAEAPIFHIADYGLVADAFQAVPEIVEGVKKIRTT